MKAFVLALALSIAALPAAAETHGAISESFTAGSGPYIGNSLSAGVSPGPVDIDLGYDFGSDTDLVLYHSIWGSLGVWLVKGLRLRIEGNFGPKTSSTTNERGFFSLGSSGVAGSVLWHPGRTGEVRPYLEVGASYDHYEVTQSSDATTPTDLINANFNQEAIRATGGVDIQDTALRLSGSKYFFSQDEGALQLPPGVGVGPSGVGAVSGSLPTRAEDVNLRGTVRQDFGNHHDWNAQFGLSYGSYVDDDGSIVAANVRFGHDLTRSLSANVGVTGQIESFGQNAGGGTRNSAFATVGITIKF